MRGVRCIYSKDLSTASSTLRNQVVKLSDMYVGCRGAVISARDDLHDVGLESIRRKPSSHCSGSYECLRNLPKSTDSRQRSLRNNPQRDWEN